MGERSERTGHQVVHVRENSDHELEAMFKLALNPNSQVTPTIPFRDRNLPPSFFTPPKPQKQAVHSREGSADSTGYTNSNHTGVRTSMPPTVIHGRTQSSPAMLQATQFSALPPPQHQRQRSCDLILEEQPLPSGWEMAKTPQGQVYFLNHATQKTTWQDPRKAGFNLSGSMGGSTPPQSQVSPNVSMQNLQQIQNLPMPEGWEQAVTPEGEVYYINHMDRSTSWFDPRLPMHMQRLNVRPQGSPGLPMGVGQVRSGGPPNLGQPPNIQQTALQKLQEEKELLRKRQEELNRQEMALRNSNVMNPSVDPSSELTQIGDPFLGQNTGDPHVRQGSTDSGLGGMGSGSSFMSRTPEEFLSNVSEMEAQDGSHRQGDFNNMDMGSIDNEHSNMDSDDLVPSLQPDDISNELLNDVETVLNNKMDDSLLTWL
ncbi:transcriptional coactivator YAP1-like isoform X2 [Mya arenaria]|uniref:transcriptional coactivator YAP1-like isoform X2 n=1 Tax=Mya arenaria TaxID=6604 RepID=UPI0022E98251|nr:transcriptional coactivator YAP1-like isoform X2 [Mya arenaria]